MVAGRFGVGTSAISIPHEVAPVVSYYGDNRDNLAAEVLKPDDPESHGIKHDHDSQESTAGNYLKAPLTPIDTPFIHIDLVQAVNAAERSLQQSSRQDFKQ